MLGGTFTCGLTHFPAAALESPSGPLNVDLDVGLRRFLRIVCGYYTATRSERANVKGHRAQMFL